MKILVHITSTPTHAEPEEYVDLLYNSSDVAVCIQWPPRRKNQPVWGSLADYKEKNRQAFSVSPRHYSEK